MITKRIIVKEVLLLNKQVDKRVKRPLSSSKSELPFHVVFQIVFQVSRSPSKSHFKKDYSGGLYVLINVTISLFYKFLE